MGVTEVCACVCMCVHVCSCVCMCLVFDGDYIQTSFFGEETFSLNLLVIVVLVVVVVVPAIVDETDPSDEELIDVFSPFFMNLL